MKLSIRQSMRVSRCRSPCMRRPENDIIPYRFCPYGRIGFFVLSAASVETQPDFTASKIRYRIVALYTKYISVKRFYYDVIRYYLIFLSLIVRISV